MVCHAFLPPHKRLEYSTVRTEVFSTKSPWSVFFRGEML